MDYLTTHPWLTFKLDLNEIDANTWRLLGEVESKLEHLAGVPLPPELAQQLHQIYLTKGAHGTTQIEGNTLSEAEVLALVNNDLKLPPSQEYLAQEIVNIIVACNTIGEDIIHQRSLDLTPDRIAYFNGLVLENLPGEEDVTPGVLRTKSVLVGNVYRGAPAADCPHLVEKLCTWVNGLPAAAPPELRTATEILAAIIAHLYFAWIHPYGNGNGRTARLVEFQLLARAGAPTPAAHLLSNHYSRTRTRYYQVLREASRGPSFSPAGFIRYAVEGFVDGLREQIRYVQAQQLGVIWTNLIHEAIIADTSGKETVVSGRQRLLAMSLPVNETVQINQIPMLTPELAALYAGKTYKTVTRDVNKLVNLGLAAKELSGVRPRVEQLQAFLPARVDRTLPAAA